jgi:hypothetical protein
MTLVTKYQISAINSYWEKCDEKHLGRTEVKQYTPLSLRGGGYNKKQFNYYIWSQASYRYPISWEAFLDPSDSYFLFADLVGFSTHWTYMHIFRHIFLSNYWWQRSDIWSQAQLAQWFSEKKIEMWKVYRRRMPSDGNSSHGPLVQVN